MSAFVHPPLAGILQSGRAEFNDRFARMKRRHPDLDGEAFAMVLRTMVDPVAEAVAAVAPERLPAVVWAAYDAALIVVAEKLAGPGGRHAVIAEAWKNLLPALAPLVALAPRRMIAAVTNALCQLATTPDAQVEKWTAQLQPIAAELASVDDFLRAGQVAAWRCGLAHYREGALAAAAELPPALALRLLSAPPNAAWDEVLARLRAARWWQPAAAVSTEPLRVVRTAGAFRGFGGLFAEPPRVAAVDGQIFVRSGSSQWLLTADCFGATFHRAEAAEFDAAAREANPARIANSSVNLNGARRDLPELGGLTSAAATSETVAVTGRWTHAITLLAVT
jgi:hypothetical protein